MEKGHTGLTGDETPGPKPHKEFTGIVFTKGRLIPGRFSDFPNTVALAEAYFFLYNQGSSHRGSAKDQRTAVDYFLP